jgi:hypothetical protein
LFDAEGFVGEHYVALANSSKQLITQIHLLLSRIGIESTISPTNIKDRILGRSKIKGGNFWRIAVGGKKNIELFSTLVGFSCKSKFLKLEIVRNKMKSNFNKSSLPYTKDQKLVRVRSVTPRELDHPIKVFDLEISGSHNYMANGVVVHNSISDDQLLLAQNEVYRTWKDGAIVDVFEADTIVHRKYRFNGKFDSYVAGRGGTDLNPACKEVDAARIYDIMVYFTDFGCPEVEKIRVPTLWLLSNDHIKPEEYPASFGRVVRVPDPTAEVE